jgi:class 3 adenylate cyclase
MPDDRSTATKFNSNEPAGGADDSSTARRAPFGSLGYLGAGLSVAFCYADALTGLLAPLAGVEPVGINPHVQAVLMWGTALVALSGLYWDLRMHGSRLPLGLGVLGFLIIASTLYTYYDIRILILGYLALVAAVLLNPIKMLATLNRAVRSKAEELAVLNTTLKVRVSDQVEEIERLARLRRFLSSEVADLITAEGKDSLLESHRRMVACLFCDVRNFTAFSDSVEPEEVMGVLQSVHEKIGSLVEDHGGTIGYRAGDGLMVIFNDPLPCEDPVMKAVNLANKMKSTFAEVQEYWRQRGHNLGFGIGIAYGYATLGLIGSEGRYDYTAIGNAVNVAARLCDRAEDGEVLADQRAKAEIDGRFEVNAKGPLELKGIGKPVEAFNITPLG